MKKIHFFILTSFLLGGIMFSVIQIIQAVAPNPGHSIGEIEPGENGQFLTTSGGVAAWATSPAIPSGMIAMFDTDCPANWTRFSALDDKFPQGAVAYGGTGGALSKTTSGHQHETTVGYLWDGDSYRFRYQNAAAPFGTGATVDMRGEIQDTYSGVAKNTGRALTQSKTDTISDIRPPYLNVIWCKKD